MIKHHSKLLPLFLTFTFLLLLSACGSEDPTPQRQKVTVTLGLQGSAATVVGSVDVDVVLPDGFVLEMDNPSGQPIDTALSLLVSGATFSSNYIPETSIANGEIIVGIIKGDGFAGNASLVQISRTYAAGTTLPTADDFIVTVVASDLDGVPLTDITGQINIDTEPVPAPATPPL